MPPQRLNRFLALLLAVTLAGCGQVPAAAARATLAPAGRSGGLAALADQTVGRLADFAWLTGRWGGSFNGLPLEEAWLSPAAGLMTVTMQLNDHKRPLMLQIGSLEETPQGVTFRFRHFTPDLTPLEGEPAMLHLVKLEPRRADFENPVHGRPKRTSFIRDNDDTLRVRSEIVNGDKTEIHEAVVVRLR